MAIRLLILWLLTEGPMHGYGIKRILTGDGLNFWFPVEDASIYSALRTLLKQGLVRSAGKGRHGARPRHERFAITPAGRREYRRMLPLALGNVSPPEGAVNAALAAEHDFAEGGFCAALQQREQAVVARLKSLEASARATPSALMVERERALLQAELQWCRSAVVSAPSHKGGGT
jgi:DNA-binding PadR family transcriptional regulator